MLHLLLQPQRPRHLLLQLQLLQQRRQHLLQPLKLLLSPLKPASPQMRPPPPLLMPQLPQWLHQPLKPLQLQPQHRLRHPSLLQPLSQHLQNPALSMV